MIYQQYLKLSLIANYSTLEKLVVPDIALFIDLNLLENIDSDCWAGGKRVLTQTLEIIEVIIQGRCGMMFSTGSVSS